jgi:hypothetical protein
MNKSNIQATTIEISIRGNELNCFGQDTTPLLEVQELLYEFFKIKINLESE